MYFVIRRNFCNVVHFGLTFMFCRNILSSLIDNDNRYHKYYFIIQSFIGGLYMKSALLKPIYSTTLITALLTSATPAFAASAEQVVVATTQEDIAELTLDEAIDRAINSNIDLRMLKLDSDSAYYTTRLTIFNTNAIKIDSLSSLNGAKSKYETAADAIRDHLVAESSWKTQENTLLQLLPIEEYKKTAYERRPDMVKASAEKAFAQAKVNYIDSYASLSTYPGRIAQNDLEKNELLCQKTQRKSDKEIEENYAKVTRARQAMEESSADEKSAEERYHTTYIAFLNGKASAAELAKQEEKWLASSTKSVDTTYQYNVAVASLQYSAGF